METIPALLKARLAHALASEEERGQASVQAAADGRFGDYQSNVAMVLAKGRRASPRAVAAEILGRLEVEDLCEKPEVAGAGFLNFRLRPEWVATRLVAMLADPRLGVPQEGVGRKMVVDFSGPNVAKPMHVGHIRSTILGDALCRLARWCGWHVVGDNHIGDWGTQFGMLLHGWKTMLDRAALAEDALAEMERIYKTISARAKEDPATLAAVHQELVKLQGGDAENLALWQEMQRLSQRQFDEVYTRLGVRFDVMLGESFYNAELQPLVAELRARELARESEGAWCVFSDGQLPPEKDPFLIRDQEGWRPNPALVLKKDGAANYTTTDLATLHYRVREWAPEQMVYVTDGRQQLHFRQVFGIFARWQPEAAASTRLAHVWFGAILGEDNRPFKTRSGEVVKLRDLLDEAEERALRVVREKNPELPAEEAREIARVIGLGAVKYADLLPNRQSDYVFSWDRMLSLQGNTAPYLLNAYVRIQAIFRKRGEDAGPVNVQAAPLLQAPEELALAKRLLQFGETVPQVLEDFRPNGLANYLFELANTFHGFYEACPVLKEGVEAEARRSRLLLCAATGEVLRAGLGLLGIEVVERM